MASAAYVEANADGLSLSAAKRTCRRRVPSSDRILRTISTGVSVANAAMGMFNSYAEIGQRALTKYRSLSTDLFVQDS